MRLIEIPKIMSLKTCIFLFVVLLSGCDLVEITIQGDSASHAKLQRCSGLKIDVVFQQDSLPPGIFSGIIEGENLKFQMSSYNPFNFQRPLNMLFIVRGSSLNRSCQFKKGSTYEARNIMLRNVDNFRETYEVELNKFRKIN